MKEVESNMDRKINLPVTWSVCGIVEIEAPSIEAAIKRFIASIEHIPLPQDGQVYVDGSFELTSDEPEFIKCYN